MIIEVTTHVEVADISAALKLVPGEIQHVSVSDKQTKYGVSRQ